MATSVLVPLLQQLEAIVRQAAEQELQFGPTWLADLSVANISVVNELRNAAEGGRLIPGPGFDLTALLGQSWVEVHDEVDPLVAKINDALNGSRHDT
jgi:hypothetical protein